MPIKYTYNINNNSKIFIVLFLFSIIFIYQLQLNHKNIEGFKFKRPKMPNFKKIANDAAAKAKQAAEKAKQIADKIAEELKIAKALTDVFNALGHLTTDISKLTHSISNVKF